MASLSHHPRLTVNHQMHPIPIHKHSQVIFLYRIASYLVIIFYHIWYRHAKHC